MYLRFIALIPERNQYLHCRKFLAFCKTLRHLRSLVAFVRWCHIDYSHEAKTNKSFVTQHPCYIVFYISNSAPFLNAVTMSVK